MADSANENQSDAAAETGLDHGARNEKRGQHQPDDWIGITASALATGRVPVSANAETPSSTIAPPGTGRTIEPTIVATKIANKCHDWAVIPAGTGINKTTEAGRKRLPI